MKIVSIILFAFVIALTISSCRKDTFITSKNALLSLSSDTLYFDTVFTTTGSITGSFKIFNNNNQKLLLSNVQLMGGVNSYFKFNLDGTAGTSFNNITLLANDSIYGFVTVSINPNASNLPFLIRDSIRITYNGDTAYVQLAAYGQNANFLKNVEIKKDTTWTNTWPIVLLGNLSVDAGKTLTIQKGTRVYVNANATFTINGSLQAVGANSRHDSDRISFQGDRLDVPYNGFPGSWAGITFTASSTNNFMQYCNINNGYNGVSVVGPAANSTPVLTLDKCIINNIYNIGIGAANSNIIATNCLVSNCGNNVNISAGGYDSFNQCTIVSYDNSYVSHINPVVSISNSDSYGITYPLSCSITNSILYGLGSLVTDEVVFAKTVTPANVNFNNVLFKDKDDISNYVKFNNYCQANVIPLFKNIDVGDLIFDFHLVNNSATTNPAIKAGATTTLLTDLDDSTRPALTPDLGCYQTQ